MNPDLLKLVQWLSPAFPTGAFAYSQGLEAAISQGLIHDAPSLEVWLTAVLAHGSGWQDAILLSRSLDGSDHAALSDYAFALCNSKERLQETRDLGAAFARGVRALGEEAQDHALPVAVGQAAATLSLDAAEVIALYLHSMTSNLVSAAVRFVPLGQSDGQAVLSRLHPTITGIAKRAATATLDDATSATLGADMAAMQHETMDVRIFRT